MVTNSAINQTTAAAGKVLQGAGVGVAPTFSTPTYPSTSGTSRKILVSDGTDNVYSTETWAVPGTAGNMLTSNGTNWNSSTPASPILIYEANVTLTSTQVKSLRASPVTLVPAQGAGTVIEVFNCYSVMIYGGSNVFTGTGVARIGYSDTSGLVIIATALQSGSITSTSSQNLFNAALTDGSSAAVASLENLPVVIYKSTSGEYGGNAAEDNTIKVSILYRVVTL